MDASPQPKDRSTRRPAAAGAASAALTAAAEGGAVRQTRIQKRNRRRILEAALDVFSADGYSGATIDRIAEAAGLSKPNVLYYFPSKEGIHAELLAGLLEVWLQPMQDLDPDGDPLEQVLAYVSRKLAMSRDMPRESRLFAAEVFAGAPRLHGILQGRLKQLVARTAAVIEGWIAAGRLAPVDPVHLIFAIWSTTQHYADFETQVRAVLDPAADPWEGADRFLQTLFRKLLAV